MRVLQNRRRDLYEEAHRIEEELVDSARVQHRNHLIQKADRLAGITDPDERREALEKAGLRIALWDEPFELWGHESWWRRTK